MASDSIGCYVRRRHMHVALLIGHGENTSEEMAYATVVWSIHFQDIYENCCVTPMIQQHYNINYRFGLITAMHISML